MAKGQKHSNREVRKPKQGKVAPKPATPFASQVNVDFGKKPKGKD